MKEENKVIIVGRIPRCLRRGSLLDSKNRLNKKGDVNNVQI